MIKSVILGVAISTALSGCTHNKVRISQTSDTGLTCPQINNEIERMELERSAIEDKTGFSGRNVAMGLIFWPGVLVNESQASSADKSIAARIEHLMQLKYQKNCPL